MSRSLKTLNPEQRLAVTTTEGPLLLLAGAGSGKTRVITERIVYLLEEKKVNPTEILAVTFTNKASQEMKTRVAELLRKPAKGLVVSTFHSLGARILRSYIDRLGYTRNFTICSESEKNELLKKVYETIPGRRSLEIKFISAAISKFKNSSSPEADFSDYDDGRLLNEINRLYAERLRLNNLVDFDDLLLLPLHLIEEYPDVLEQMQDRFRYFMVDEYQDTNRLQFNLISKLAKKTRNICVVGDDDQSIYTWRGADERNILEFDKFWPGAKIIKLEQNYRSTEIILNAANAVISNNKKRRVKNLWTAIKGGQKIVHFMGDTPHQEAEEVINRIRQHQVRDQASLGEVAVLYRRNAQSRVLEEIFRINQIPYHLIGSTNFFERREIKDIFAYLNLIANPKDELSLADAVAAPKRGIGSQTLQWIRKFAFSENISLLEAMKRVRENKSIIESRMPVIADFAELVDKYHKLQTQLSPSHMTRDLLKEIDYDSHIKSISKDEKEHKRRSKVVDDFVQSLENYERKVTNPTLHKYLERISLITREDRREDIHKGQVTLMTIHSAKGLEFPFVFIVGMEDGVFPSRISVEEGNITEERRLFYVAVTRAKKQLYISQAKERKLYGETKVSEPSRFLAEIPDEYYETPPGTKNLKNEREDRSREAARAFFKKRKDLLR